MLLIDDLLKNLLAVIFTELVDQDALVEALREKRIRGAGLDVMTPEPLPSGHPLMALDNVSTYIINTVLNENITCTLSMIPNVIWLFS